MFSTSKSCQRNVFSIGSDKNHPCKSINALLDLQLQLENS